ncbi:hypothetical protein GW932_01495 [archaeon]|nr:hypothetical protein [archaeon]
MNKENLLFLLNLSIKGKIGKTGIIPMEQYLVNKGLIKITQGREKNNPLYKEYYVLTELGYLFLDEMSLLSLDAYKNAKAKVEEPWLITQ